jgi:8-oxo-dGTP diphosphatase
MNIVRVTCALMEKSGLLFAARRSPSMPYSGFWEFPGGKVKDGEGLEACLLREIEEELGVHILIKAALEPVPIRTLGQPADKIMTLYPFVCEIASGNITLREHDDSIWGSFEDLMCLKFLSADIEVLEGYKTYRAGLCLGGGSLS